MVMYRIHLDRISDSLVLGAVNAYRNGKVGNGMNVLNDNIESYPYISKRIQKWYLKWIILADKNYGDGSSREHAAMSPRYLGCAAVIARSFARIHKPILANKEC
jgi:aconitate hydratase A / 2-methylisocitrate dehydratase